MRKIQFATLVFLTFILSMSTTSTFANSTQSGTVSSEAELLEAINNGKNSIVIHNDIYLEQSVEINHHLTLSGTATIYVPITHKHFIVWEDGKLILDGDMSLKITEGSWIDVDSDLQVGGGIHILGGRLELYAGRIYGADIGVRIEEYGTFNMFNGTVSHSRRSGVLVEDGSSFRMYGGIISNNMNSGVSLSRSTFTMYDGIIRENTNDLAALHESGGGGVRVSEFSTFIMKGGGITENEASRGAGVLIEESRFDMYGGTIRGNTATSWGGGIYLGVFRNQLRIFAGQVSENMATHGGGISSFGRHNSIVIHGAVIQGNVAKEKGGGIFLNRSLFSLSITGGAITENVAEIGGGIFSVNPQMLAIGSEVIFSRNEAENSSNFGKTSGREIFPNIMWAGENSISGTHLLNNYDISYEGLWIPSLLQIYIFIVGITAILMIIRAVIYYRKQKFPVIASCLLLFISFWFFFGGTSVMAIHEIRAVTNEAELREAISLSEVAPIPIVVEGIIPIEETIEINHSVTLWGTGTITVAGDFRHFTVLEGGRLSIGDDLTLTQAETYEGAGGGITVRFGTLRMNGGEIKGNIAPEGRNGLGGGVLVYYGTFYFNGGSIYGNKATFGGGIALRGWSVLLIDGGEIVNNHAFVDGGGIATGSSHPTLTDLANVRMYSGSIRENVAEFAGGGIFTESAFLKLLGGEIYSNTASGHGGIITTGFGDRVLIGENMRIFNNYPPSFYDTQEGFNLIWFIHPDGYRFAGLLLIAIIGTWFTYKSRKRKLV